MSLNTNFIGYDTIVVKGKINSYLKSNFKEFNFGGDNVVNTSYVVYYIMKITQLPFFAPKKLPFRVSVLYKDGDTHLNITYFDNDNASKIKAVLDEKKQNIIDFFSQPQNMGIYFIVDHIVDSLKIKNEIFKEIDTVTNTSHDNNDYKVEWEYENSEKKTQFIIFPHNDNIQAFLVPEIKDGIFNILSKNEYSLYPRSTASLTFSIPKICGDNERVSYESVRDGVLPIIRDNFKKWRLFDKHEHVFTIKIFDTVTFTLKEMDKFENHIFKVTSIPMKGYINQGLSDEAEEIFSNHATSAKEPTEIDVINNGPINSFKPSSLPSTPYLKAVLSSKSPGASCTSTPTPRETERCTPSPSLLLFLNSSEKSVPQTPISWASDAEEEEEERKLMLRSYSPDIDSNNQEEEVKVQEEEVNVQEKEVDVQEEEVHKEKVTKKVVESSQTSSRKRFVTLSKEDVSEIIASIGDAFKSYKNIFIDNGFDGDYLSQCDQTDLETFLIKECEVKKMHAGRICIEIGRQILRDQEN